MWQDIPIFKTVKNASVHPDTIKTYLDYFEDSFLINRANVKNDFLLRAITALENGTYNKSEELQNAFTKYKNSSEFAV